MEGSVFGAMFVILVLMLVYLVPSIVAWRRNHAQFSGIIILNLFLGWTLLGWVGALIWAVLSKSDDSLND